MSANRNTIPQAAFIGIVVACVLFTALDLTYEKHPYVKFEGWFNFYGFASGIASVACIALARWARPILSDREGPS